MSEFSVNHHLSREDIIKNGSFFTPEHLTELVFEKSEQYIDSNTTLLDIGTGYGAFAEMFSSVGGRHIATENDIFSAELFRENFENWEFYFENSLLNVSREKYDISDSEKLFIIGNPPYNDTTSRYKKGEKGSVVCDTDLFSRDLGISFLKAYDKLKADFLCILHPLSYLIKKQNFKYLGDFKNNYTLLDATVFSSKEFETIKKSAADFPVVCALYKRCQNGMDFDYIKHFRFEIFGEANSFCIDDFETIDGRIKKYPTKNSNCKIQFYTQRDMNSLFRNIGFVTGPISNGIDVNIENLYEYAWLFFLKNNFNPPKYKYIYGNFSPFYTESVNDKAIKKLLVAYAYNNCGIVKTAFSKETIKRHYGDIENLNDYSLLNGLVEKFYI